MRGSPSRQQPTGLLPPPLPRFGDKRISPVATGEAGLRPTTLYPFEKGERKLYVSYRVIGCAPPKPSHDDTRHSASLLAQFR